METPQKEHILKPQSISYKSYNFKKFAIKLIIFLFFRFSYRKKNNSFIKNTKQIKKKTKFCECNEKSLHKVFLKLNKILK